MTRLLKELSAAALAVVSSALLAVEPYPSKPVTLISSFNAGAGPDAWLRVLAVSLSDSLGQPFVVENRPGGLANLLAYQAMARARPDGHTFFLGSPSITYFKLLYPNADANPMIDLVPVVNIIWGGGPVLLVRSDSSAMQMQDLVARMKANPGKLNYASGGIASLDHFAAMTFLNVTGTNAINIPYKGGDAATIALLRGEVEFAMPTFSFALPQVKSGKMRALGIASATRHKDLPEVPTLPDALKSDLLALQVWSGLFAPARTPEDVIKKMHAATIKALGGGPLQKAIEATGAAIRPSRSPEEFAALVRRDYEKWAEIVKRSGIKAE